MNIKGFGFVFSGLLILLNEVKNFGSSGARFNFKSSQDQDDSQFFNDAQKSIEEILSWAAHRSDLINYGALFMASSLVGITPTNSAAIAAVFFSASETAQAIKIGDKNYKTSIYLGPNINFNEKLENEKEEQKKGCYTIGI